MAGQEAWTHRGRRCSGARGVAVKHAACLVLVWTTVTACETEPPLPIHRVQGAGGASPYRGVEVRLEESVVTAVGNRGFFVRSRPGREDSDPSTSEGLYVYLGRRPELTAGERVRLQGRVIEFHGHTQLTDPAWTVTGRGRVPAPVVLNDAPAHGWRSLESMRVSVADGMVAGPTDRRGNARMAVAGGRPFRRSGDRRGEPRVIRLNPAGLGGEGRLLAAGSRVRADGPVVFRHDEFTLWPQRLKLVSDAGLPRPARAPAPGEIAVATFNLRGFHDEVAAGDEPTVSPEAFRARLRKLAGWLERLMHCPDVVAVQEVESVEVLGRLAAATDCGYRALGGERRRGPGLGYLVSAPQSEARELGTGELLSVDGSALFDRPPLMLRFPVPATGERMLVINVHLRSLIGMDDERVRRKRLEQAETLRSLVETAAEEAGGRLVVLGDFNAFEFSDGVVDVLARVTGARPMRDAFPAPQSRNALLDNRGAELPRKERYSYIHRGVSQLLDHVLTGRALRDRVAGAAVARGNADAPFPLRHDPDTPLRASDHDPVILYLTP